MNAETATLLISFLTLFGVLLGNVLPVYLRIRELKLQEKSQSEAKWIAYLEKQQDRLMNLNMQLNPQMYQILGILLSIDDKELQKIAQNDTYKEGKKLEEGILRIGQLIREQLDKK